jgi:hypothetical protein
VTTRHRFTTQLSVEECRERLKRDTSPAPAFQFAMPDRETFYCKFSGHGFRLYALTGAWRNSMMPFFCGRLRSTEAGTILEGTMGPHAIVKAFMWVWFSIAGFMLFLIASAAISGTGHFAVHPVIAALPIVFIAAMGGAIYKVGCMLGKVQERRMLEFLSSTLEAKQGG